MTCKDGPCASCKCAPSVQQARRQRLWRVDNAEQMSEDVVAAAAGPSTAFTASPRPAPSASTDKGVASHDHGGHVAAVSSSTSPPPSFGEACGLETSSSSAAPAREKCCKTLKEQEASTIDPDLIRDVIIGLSDGLTVPFALTAGLSGTNSSRIVVIAGLAELVSGAISMGVGGFLSAQTEVDHYRYRLATTRERVKASCEAQLERDVAEILGPFGVPSSETGRITRVLQGTEERIERERRMAEERGETGALGQLKRRKEQVRRFSWLAHLPVVGSTVDRSEGGSRDVDTEAGAGAAVEGKEKRSAEHVDEKLADADAEDDEERERGLTAFLLRVGEGMEPVSMRRAYISAVAMGLSYFLGGLVSLIPYFCTSDVYKALYISISVTGVVLFVFGAVKMRASGAPPSVRVYLFGALSTLLVGAAAAAASFGIVRALEHNKSIGGA